MRVGASQGGDGMRDELWWPTHAGAGLGQKPEASDVIIWELPGGPMTGMASE